MECLVCNYIETSPVTLRDGRVVCSSCPAWRHECEARHVANMATNEARKKYLEKVREARGNAAAYAIRKEAAEIMNNALGNGRAGIIGTSR